MDDDLLVYGTYQQRDSAMSTMRAMGVDGVRVTVSWKFVSGEQSGRPRRRPPRLRGSARRTPGTTGRTSGTASTTSCAWPRRTASRSCSTPPGPGRYGLRAAPPEAAASTSPRGSPARPRSASSSSRWGAGTPAPGWTRTRTAPSSPRVVVWSIYNEPDQPASLSPQMEFNKKLRRQIPVAPILYREIYYAATAALRQTGHGDDLIMMGETAPLGRCATPRASTCGPSCSYARCSASSATGDRIPASRRGSAGAASSNATARSWSRRSPTIPIRRRTRPGGAIASRTRSTWRTSGSAGAPRRPRRVDGPHPEGPADRRSPRSAGRPVPPIPRGASRSSTRPTG